MFFNFGHKFPAGFQCMSSYCSVQTLLNIIFSYMKQNTKSSEIGALRMVLQPKMSCRWIKENMKNKQPINISLKISLTQQNGLKNVIGRLVLSSLISFMDFLMDCRISYRDLRVL